MTFAKRQRLYRLAYRIQTWAIEHPIGSRRHDRLMDRFRHFARMLGVDA